MSQYRKSKSADSAADASKSVSSSDGNDKKALRLKTESGLYGVCRLDAQARIPRWIHKGGFFSVTRTDDELSILCLQEHVPGGVTCERDWRLIKVLGTLDFSLIGVLASMAQPLADARIGLLTVSTYDTDYLMVRAAKLEAAVEALRSAGHRFETETTETARQGETPEQKDEAPEHKTAPESSTGPAPAAEADVAEEKPQPRSRSRRRSSQRGDARRRRASDRREPVRHGGSLYIGEDWEHIEAASSEPSSDEAEPSEPEAETAAPSPSKRKRRRRSRSRRAQEESPRPAREESRPAVQLESSDLTPADEPPPAAIADRPPAITEEAGEPRTDDPPPAALGPVDELPSDELPADELPADELPADELPADELPADELPADELPADERELIDEGDNAEGLYTGAIPQHPVETTEDDFSSLGLSPRMIQTLDEIGFVHPTPIQAAVLPMALEGSDIIGLAETGSGKTAAFGLPLAERLHHGRGVRGLILCPTREIALQTKAFLDIFGRDHELETAVVIGGVKFGPQISALRRHPDIIVATPGRLADHMRRGNVRMNKIEELVLDEADHMLDLGFLPQIQEIVARVPRERRTMMFSATMPPAIERLAQRFLNDPYIVDLRPVNRVASGIEHRLYLVESGQERPCLIALLDEVDDTTLVFARRKLDTEFLARQLQKAGLPAERIHSDRSQAQRVAALRGFREGKKRILVATDVAARGIDVPHLGHVINFGLPDTVEDYVHRAGRTARGKAVGIVSSIGTWQDKPMVQEIERTLGQSIRRCEVEGVPAYRELKPRRGRRRRRLL